MYAENQVKIERVEVTEEMLYQERCDPSPFQTKTCKSVLGIDDTEEKTWIRETWNKRHQIDVFHFVAGYKLASRSHSLPVLSKTHNRMGANRMDDPL